ncbi:hypothetical protein C3L33_22299, partial [Rhododendron williamsianum]
MVGLLLLSFFAGDVSALSVTVNDVECVSEYVFYEGDGVSGNFVVLEHVPSFTLSTLVNISDGILIDVSFVVPNNLGIGVEPWFLKPQVSSPAGNVVHSVKGTSGDKFEFRAPSSGMYKFCFHNPHSTPETVSFYIHIGHIPNEHDLAKDEHLDPINVKIAELREALEAVTAEQKFLKARDTRHRRTNESTRKRVIFYTLGEYILLAIASALQVVYIRRLFSKSVGYNRV